MKNKPPDYLCLGELANAQMGLVCRFTSHSIAKSKSYLISKTKRRLIYAVQRNNLIA